MGDDNLGRDTLNVIAGMMVGIAIVVIFGCVLFAIVALGIPY